MRTCMGRQDVQLVRQMLDEMSHGPEPSFEYCETV